jgi:hypothetical protein
LGPQLQGKLHVFVGAQDTFHANDSVVLMQDALRKLGSDAAVQIVPGDDHWQILDCHGGLIGYALAEMLQRLTPTLPLGHPSTALRVTLLRSALRLRSG